MPLFYGSVGEGLAYLRVSDEDWAEYARLLHLAAVKRGEGEAPAEDDGTT